MSVINPKSGRSVKPNTRTFKSLQKEFTLENGVFVPKDKTKYGYSNVLKYWVPRAKLPEHYTVRNNRITVERDYAITPNKKMVSIESPAFQKWVNLGYTYNSFVHAFENPANRSMDIDGDIVQFVEDLNFTGWVRLNGGGVEDLFEISNNHDFIDAIYNFMYNYDLSQDDIRVDLYEARPQIKHGPLFDGEVNCLIELLAKHLNGCPRLLAKLNPMFKKYEDGVFPEDIEAICSDLKTNITIHTASDVISYGNNTSDNKYSKILHVGVSKNHAITYVSVKRVDPEIVHIQENSIIDAEDIFAFKQSVTMKESLILACNEDISNVLSVRMDRNSEILGYSTPTQIFKYKEHLGFELSDDEFSYLDKAFNQTMKLFTNTPQTCKFEVKDMCMPLCFSKKISGTRQMLDLQGAYNHFPDVLPGDIKQIVNTTARLDVPYAFYIVLFQCPIERRVVRKLISQEVLSVLEKHNVQHMIYQAYVSSFTTSLDASQIIDKYPKRTFHKVIGRFQRCYKQKCFVTSHPEEAMKYGGRPISDTELFMCNKGRKFYPKSYYPHIAGAIIQYTTSRLYDTVLENDLNVDRAWVDSLVCDVSNIECPEGYSIKTKDYHLISKATPRISLFKKHTTEFVELPKERIHFIHGSAGTGKSTMAKNILANIPSSIVIAPTNLVCCMYSRAYTIDNWITNSRGDIPYGKYDTILLDEFSMLNTERLEYLLKTFSTYRFILFGDSKQLPPIVGDRIDIEKYAHTELTTVHRQVDKLFVSELEDVFTYGKPIELDTMSIDDGIKNGARFACCINSHVNRINERAYVMSKGEVITKTLKSGMLAFVDDNKYKRSLGIPRNEICTIIDKSNVSINGEVYPISASSCKPAVAMTVHKLQGQTVDSMLVIDFHGINMFSKSTRHRMMYTTYTRVRSKSQLRNITI